MKKSLLVLMTAVAFVMLAACSDDSVDNGGGTATGLNTEPAD